MTLALAAACALCGPPTLRFDNGRFEVVGLPTKSLAALAQPADQAAALAVRVGPEATLLGTHGLTDGVLWFRPRFPLAVGVRHVAVFEPAGLNLEITPAIPKLPPPRVVAIHPSGDKLPENLLRLYLSFTRPMRQGESARRLRLLDEAGKPIDLPFLELDEELWDPAGVRLTVLIDPGRIKRGLKPREDVGAVLEMAHKYTLEIDAGWADEDGRPLGAVFRKPFTVIAPASRRLQPTGWRLTPPSGADGALTARFPSPLDHALALRLLTVEDAAGKPVAGAATLAEGETLFRFKPNAPWRAGGYHLRVGQDLEDVAGNRADRPFDADGVTGAVRVAPADTLLRFAVPR